MTGTNPKSPSVDVPAKDSAKQRVAEAESLYDAPNRQDIVEANRNLKKARAPRNPDDPDDAVLDVNVRKPV